MSKKLTPSENKIEKNALKRERKHKQAELQKLNSLNVLNYESYETLYVNPKNPSTYIESDTKFLRDVEKMVKVRNKGIMNILDINKSELTNAQCDELDYRAHLHSRANIINENTKEEWKNIHEDDQCHCGCKRGRGDYIPIFADETKLSILGPGILLLFLFNRSIIFILLIPIIIYGIFALVSNLIGSESFPSESCQENLYCLFKTNSSDENKSLTNNLRWVQQWLGLSFCIIWILAMSALKQVGRAKNVIIDEDLISSADNTIKIENLPRNCYEEKELIDFLESWWEKADQEEKQNKRQEKQQKEKEEQSESDSQNGNKNTFYKKESIKDAINPFKIKSIQIVYNMEFSRQMIDQIFFYSCSLSSLLEENEKGEKCIVVHVDEYRKTKSKLKQTYELLLDLRKKFLNDPEFRKGLATTCCLIEFRSEKIRDRIIRNCGVSKVGIIKQFQALIRRFFGETREIVFKGKILKVEEAPEPSDILWTNCEKQSSIWKIIGIYILTFLIMLFSFAVLTGLNYLQDYYKKLEEANDMIQTVLNIVMSLAMNIVNKILWFSLFYFLDEEYNHTLTDKIISQMNKIIILTSLNIIAFPIITNYIVLKSSFLYGNDGLAGLAFDYQISCIIQALTKIFDPMMILKKVAITIKWLRYWLIRYNCRNFEEEEWRIKGHPAVNSFYEGEYFDVAENYIFITAAILQAAFFAHLQPMVLFLVIFVIAFFYITSRIKLLRICKIPEMTEYLVFETAISFLGWVPIFYGTGAIVISFLQHRDSEVYPFHFISGAICIVVGAIALMNPKNFIGNFVLWIIYKLKNITCCNKALDIVKSPEANKEADTQEDDSESDISVKDMATQNETLTAKTINRVESYYDASNSLSLLGFEILLKGENAKNVSQELSRFCESFFPKISEVKVFEVKTAIKVLAKSYGNILGFGTEEKPKKKLLDPLPGHKKGEESKKEIDQKFFLEENHDDKKEEEAMESSKVLEKEPNAEENSETSLKNNMFLLGPK